MAAATSTFISFTSRLTFPSHPWEGHRQGGNHAEAPQGLSLRESGTRVSRSGGGVEADPGQVGQPGDPLGTHHRRKGAKHARQTPGRHHRHTVDDDLARGTWAPWTAMAPPPRRGRPGPGRPGPPGRPPRAGGGRADSGHATAAQTHRAPAGPDSHQARGRHPDPSVAPGTSSACFPDRRPRIQTHLIQMNPAD
jgi:hypothetical protein